MNKRTNALKSPACVAAMIEGMTGSVASTDETDAKNILHAMSN